MAGIKISNLPAVTTAALSDVFPVVQGGVTNKESITQLATLLNSNLTFLPLSGGTLTGSLLLNADPTLALGAATKQYVDQTALNGTSVYAASATSLGTVTQLGAGIGATLTNGGTQAVFALDGINPPIGSNVLIKNTSTGATAANEGIYTVTNVGSASTNWILTRATSFDTPIEINNTGLIVINNGTTLAGSAWYNSANIITVDTTPFVFSRFGALGTVTNVATGGIATGGPITSTGTVTVTAAVKADQTTATSTTVAVVPAVQQFHPSAAKAWVQTTISGGVPTAAASYNVSSVTSIGTGNYTVNLTTSFTSSNYCCLGNINSSGVYGYSAVRVDSLSNQHSIQFYSATGTAAAPIQTDFNFSVAAFGTQ